MPSVLLLSVWGLSRVPCAGGPFASLVPRPGFQAYCSIASVAVRPDSSLAGKRLPVSAQFVLFDTRGIALSAIDAAQWHSCGHISTANIVLATGLERYLSTSSRPISRRISTFMLFALFALITRRHRSKSALTWGHSFYHPI